MLRRKVSHYIMSDDDLAGRGLFSKLDQYKFHGRVHGAFHESNLETVHSMDLKVSVGHYIISGSKKNQANMLMLDSLYLAGLLMLGELPRVRTKLQSQSSLPVLSSVKISKFPKP